MAWVGFIVGTRGFDNVDPVGVIWAFSAEFAHDCKATSMLCLGFGFGLLFLLSRRMRLMRKCVCKDMRHGMEERCI
jgi:hypothetical protein